MLETDNTKAIVPKGNSFSKQLANVRGMLAKGERAAAKEILLSLLQITPQDPTVQLEIAMLLVTARAFVKASAIFADVLGKLPPNAELWFRLGNAMAEVGYVEGANSAFKQALKILPRKLEFLFAYANTLITMEGHKAAIDAYQEILDIDPTHIGCLTNLAILLDEIDQYEEALNYYQKAVSCQPHDARSNTNLGNFLLRAGNISEAKRYYQDAISYDQNYRDAHCGLALVFDRLQDQESAEHHRKVAFFERPWTVSPYFGTCTPLVVLVLTSSRGGNISTKYTLDNRKFQEIQLMVEYWRPENIRDLPPYDIIFNAIGDADRSQSALAAAEDFIENTPISLLNHPTAVLKTGRAETSYVLAGIKGVTVPQTIKLTIKKLESILTDENSLKSFGFSYPIILRPPGYHTGQYCTRISCLKDATSFLEANHFNDYIMTQYVDYRSKDGYFRKYRALFIDGVLHPLHLAIGNNWMMHYFSADMKGNTSFKIEEEAFLNDIGVIGAKAVTALQAISKKLGLDYGGIDYALTDNGGILVFEANANMLIHTLDPIDEFAYRHRHVLKLVEAFQAMLRRAAIRSGNKS